MDFAVPADHRVKLKESEKRDNNRDLLKNYPPTKKKNETKKQQKLWKVKLIVIGALGTVTKGLVQGLEDLEITGRVGTIQTTALLRSARIQ